MDPIPVPCRVSIFWLFLYRAEISSNLRDFSWIICRCLFVIWTSNSHSRIRLLFEKNFFEKIFPLAFVWRVLLFRLHCFIFTACLSSKSGLFPFLLTYFPTITTTLRRFDFSFLISWRMHGMRLAGRLLFILSSYLDSAIFHHVGVSSTLSIRVALWLFVTAYLWWPNILEVGVNVVRSLGVGYTAKFPKEASRRYLRGLIAFQCYSWFCLTLAIHSYFLLQLNYLIRELWPVIFHVPRSQPASMMIL